LTVLPIALPETRRPIGILRRAASPPALAAKLLMDQLRDVGRL